MINETLMLIKPLFYIRIVILNFDHLFLKTVKNLIFSYKHDRIVVLYSAIND